jgi:hypothetical protein
MRFVYDFTKWLFLHYLWLQLPCHSSLYFHDGLRSVDFVLVWDDLLKQSNSAASQEKRKVFEGNLRSEGQQWTWNCTFWSMKQYPIPRNIFNFQIILRLQSYGMWCHVSIHTDTQTSGFQIPQRCHLGFQIYSPPLVQTFNFSFPVQVLNAQLEKKLVLIS